MFLQSSEAMLDLLTFDEEALEEMQSRMARLQGLMRTYGPGMKDVFKKIPGSSKSS